MRGDTHVRFGGRAGETDRGKLRHRASVRPYTYLPMARGFSYLTCVMDWASRRVLSFRVSNTLDASFCIEALQEALERFPAPEIMNTDQGAQFTSEGFAGLLLAHGVKISMDGRGRWLDNVFIERLWRSVKYEEVYLNRSFRPSGLVFGR